MNRMILRLPSFLLSLLHVLLVESFHLLLPSALGLEEEGERRLSASVGVEGWRNEMGARVGGEN